MKTLLPSLKEKKRYLAFDVISDSKISNSEINKVVRKRTLAFMGELNYGKAGVKFVSDRIIKVNNKFVDHLKSSLMLINEIDSKKVIFKTNKVSGILRKLKEAK